MEIKNPCKMRNIADALILQSIWLFGNKNFNYNFHKQNPKSLVSEEKKQIKNILKRVKQIKLCKIVKKRRDREKKFLKNVKNAQKKKKSVQWT